MPGLKCTRRTFAKLSAFVGLAATGSCAVSQALAESTSQNGEGEVKRIRSMCRSCGKMECPTWVTVQNGRVMDIVGDESSVTSRGNICAKGKSAPQQLYHPNRLKYPMKRTNPKGEDPGWVRISWDEAISSVANACTELIDKYGGETIKLMHGTSRISTYGIEGLTTIFRTPNCGCTAGQVCKGPREVAGGLVAFPGVHWVQLNDNPELFFQWGVNQEVSNYDNACRVTVDSQVNAKHSIVVGPRLQNLGKECDLWINLRPGTDDFIALSMTHVIVNEMHAYDDLFVKKWTNGPFLYCADLEPSGFTFENSSTISTYPHEIKTRLLKESDLIEGGNPQRFMVWDQAKGALTYYDAEAGLWEGEGEFQKPTAVRSVGEHGVIADDTPVPNGIDPALEGTYEITLKDGATVSARPVFALFSELLGDYEPEKIEDTVWVEAEKIREAAQIYGEKQGQGGIQFNLPLDHAANSVQSSRTCIYLSALTGNLDTPGGNRGGHMQNDIYNVVSIYCANLGAQPLTKDELDRIAGIDKFPLLPFAVTLNGAAKTHDMTSASDMILTGEPYPIRAMVSVTGSHTHASNSWHNWEAFKSLEFYWCSELWRSTLSELADILTPATHHLETSCMRQSQGAECGLGAQVAVIEPMGETRWDSEVCIRVAEAMGVPWWPSQAEYAPPWWPTEWLDHVWPDEQHIHDQETVPMMTGTNMPGPTGKRLECSGWDDFVEQYQEHGQWDLREISPYGYYRRYMWGLLRGDGKQGFDTPTGKLEFLSTMLESYQPGEEWPIAREPNESPYSTPEVYEEYPIVITTGRRIPVFFHTEGRQIPFLREQAPAPTFQINPETAAELGIAEGDWCWIESKRGKVRLIADLFYGIKPGVIECDHGWWFPELSAPKHGWDLCNINVLVDQYNQDPIYGSTCLRGYLCKVYKATPENSPFGNPIPCDDDGTQIICSADDPRLKEWMPVYDQGEES